MAPNWADPDAWKRPYVWNPEPSPVPGVAGAVEIASSVDVDCVRDASGAVCWSAGGWGPGPDAMPPTRLPLASVVRVATGMRDACAIDAGGAARCFAIEGGRLGPAMRVVP
jgi:hypothetical protein